MDDTLVDSDVLMDIFGDGMDFAEVQDNCGVADAKAVVPARG